MTGQELVAQKRDLVAFVQEPRFVAEIEAALPENVSAKRFVRAMTTAMLEKGEELVQADRASLYMALLRAAQDGLVPDGREGVLNVYNGKVQFLPMIYGIRRILADYGWSLRTAVIYEHDIFQYDAGEATLTHMPPRPGVDRGAMEGAYALAVHRDGRRELVVYSAADIEKVRKQSSRSQKVWNDWTDRMYEKTPAHRLAKKLPLAEADRQRLEHLFVENGDPEPEGDKLINGVYGAPRDAVPHTATSSTEKASPSVVEAGEGATSLSQAEPSPAPSEPEFHEPSDAELEAAGQTTIIDAAPSPEGEPVFDRGKFKGKTIAEAHAAGPAGLAYLEWAIREWTWGGPAMRQALDKFAEDHPEMKQKEKT